MRFNWRNAIVGFIAFQIGWWLAFALTASAADTDIGQPIRFTAADPCGRRCEWTAFRANRSERRPATNFPRLDCQHETRHAGLQTPERTMNEHDEFNGEVGDILDNGNAYHVWLDGGGEVTASYMVGFGSGLATGQRVKVESKIVEAGEAPRAAAMATGDFVIERVFRSGTTVYYGNSGFPSDRWLFDAAKARRFPSAAAAQDFISAHNLFEANVKQLAPPSER